MESITTSIEVCGIVLTACIHGQDSADFMGRGVKYKRNTYDINVGFKLKRGSWSIDYACSSINSVPSGKSISHSVKDAIFSGSIAAFNELVQTAPLLFQEAHLVRVATEREKKYQAFMKAKEEKSAANSVFYKTLASFKAAGGDASKYEVRRAE